MIICPSRNWINFPNWIDSQIKEYEWRKNNMSIVGLNMISVSHECLLFIPHGYHTKIMCPNCLHTKLLCNEFTHRIFNTLTARYLVAIHKKYTYCILYLYILYIIQNNQPNDVCIVECSGRVQGNASRTGFKSFYKRRRQQAGRHFLIWRDQIWSERRCTGFQMGFGGLI